MILLLQKQAVKNYLDQFNQILTNRMVLFTSRAAPQIFLQSIILKPLKMLMAKLYLLLVGPLAGRPTLNWAGVGDGHAYHKKLNKSLKLVNKYLLIFFSTPILFALFQQVLTC